MKGAIFSTVVHYLIEFAIVLIALFHNYESRSFAVIASLVIASYAGIRAQISGEALVSARYFLSLLDLIGPDTVDPPSRKAGEVFILARRELPFMYAGAVFYLGLVCISVLRLLVVVLL